MDLSPAVAATAAAVVASADEPVLVEVVGASISMVVCFECVRSFTVALPPVTLSAAIIYIQKY